MLEILDSSLCMSPDVQAFKVRVFASEFKF